MSVPKTPTSQETKPARVIDEQTQKHIDRFLQGHIDRFLQGKEVWNKWAEHMLAKKEELEKAGKWNVTEGYDEKRRHRTMSADHSTPEMQTWLDEAYVNFSNLIFQTEQSSDLQDGGEEMVEGINSSVKSITVSGSKIDFSNFIFPEGASFDGAKFQGWASFSEAKFQGETSFIGAEFQDGASFSEAKFQGKTSFSEAKFQGKTYFSEAKFQGETYFDGAKFQGRASFSEAKFQGRASFSEAKFQGWAYFRLVDFERHVDFSKATFHKQADFEAILVKRAFSLADAKFTSNIPNYNQANFAESPRLDNIEVIPGPKYKNLHLSAKNIFGKYNWQKYFWDKKFLPYLKGIFLRAVNRASPTLYSTIIYFSKCINHIWNKFTNTRRNPDEEAHHRALKRLAIQAHDHENEMKFFAGEIRARRHVTDFANFLTHDFASSMRYWAGVLYELTSNFGRSLLRPIALWAVLFLLFTNVYHAGANTKALQLCRDNQQKLASSLTPELTTPWSAAATITAKNSLLFISTDRTEKLKRAYTCLYGASPLYNKSYYGQYQITKSGDQAGKNKKEERVRLAPNVPGWVSFWGVINSITSLALTFLLLLAIRNQFKIK